MTLEEATLEGILRELEALGSDKVRAANVKNGAGENQFGVKLGDIRAVAKKVKKNHDLALELWETGNIDARRLAILVMKPKLLSIVELDRMVQSVTWVQVLDWFSSYVVNKHPENEQLRDGWMSSDNAMAARAGWALTAEQVAKENGELDLDSLLDRLESEMGTAASEPQWTMNTCLAQIGINHVDQRERALAIGEELGIYQDYPVSKGCTSPYAPAWIDEMVSRQS
ncbi:MAG: DNA alkylation repair protein [Acidimicrobiales bacterium]